MAYRVIGSMAEEGATEVICLRLARERPNTFTTQNKVTGDVVCEPTSPVFSPQKSSSLESALEMYR